MYGTENPRCSHVARQTLAARRLVERGVRFVQIYSGGMENERSWDGHSDIESNHRQFAGETDQPVAALLADLKNRGMLDSTLVIWGGEFGRLPVAQRSKNTNAKGRDHNPHAFTIWMAGGGVKGGFHHGATDLFGHKAEQDKVSVNDFHATILHLLGMDHTKLTFRYSGRQFRLTDVAGNVVTPILA
jgi:arylsulfatase A-like enzyme